MITNYEHQYMETLRDIYENGVLEENKRTGVRTKRLPHAQFKLDLSKDEPLLKSKTVNWKTATKEILWIMQSASNNINDLDAHIWDSWADNDGFIGLTYGYQINPTIQEGNICKVERIHRDKPEEQNNSYEWLEENLITTGDMSFKNITKNELKALKIIWQSLIKSCYDTSYMQYNSYGAKGLFVATEWLNFSNFVRDIRYVPNYILFSRQPGEYTLTPVYTGANCYAPDTVIFERFDRMYLYKESLQSELKENYRLMKITAHRLSTRNPDMKKIEEAVDKELEAKDWVYSYRVNKNQVAELIKKIKSDPSDRGMIINLWDEKHLDEDNLRPCCFNSDWTVVDGRLNCYLQQRSGDMALGVPFNTFQYATLLKMIAKACNLQPGLLTHSIVDAHIYENQFEGVEKQLARFELLQSFGSTGIPSEETEAILAECKANNIMPEDFTIEQLEEVYLSNPVTNVADLTDFYDFSLEDVTVSDYKNLGSLAFKVTV